LREELQQIRNEDLKASRTSDVATRKVQQRTNEIARESMELKDLSKVEAEHRINMGLEMNLNKERRLAVANFSQVNQRAAEIYEKGTVTQAQAIQQAEKEIATEQAAAIAKEKKNKQLAEEAALRGKVRAQLMQQSIGMFVLGITATQTLGVLSEMAGKNTELGQTFKEMGTAIRFLLGPIQVFIALQQLMAAENKKMIMSLGPIMLIVTSLWLLFKAWNSESKTLKVLLSALAGLFIGLAIAMSKNAIAAWASALGKAMDWIAGAGPGAPIMAAIIGGAMAAAFGTIIALQNAAPKGQTVPGSFRTIRDTGLFYGHRGEVVGRVGGMQMGGFASSSPAINVQINIESGVVVDEPLITQLARQLEGAVASGLGR